MISVYLHIYLYFIWAMRAPSENPTFGAVSKFLEKFDFTMNVGTWLRRFEMCLTLNNVPPDDWTVCALLLLSNPILRGLSRQVFRNLLHLVTLGVFFWIDLVRRRRHLSCSPNLLISNNRMEKIFARLVTDYPTWERRLRGGPQVAS